MLQELMIGLLIDIIDPVIPIKIIKTLHSSSEWPTYCSVVRSADDPCLC